MLYKKCTNGQITLLLTLFASFVLGSGIWSSGVITQGDESDYIRSAQEMYRSGDLLTPTLRDEARFTKPPLLYWLLVISYKIFGISLFSSRLPSVLAGVLLSVTMFRFGKYLYGRDAGVLSALLTITSFGMVKFSKIALMEIPLALCILLSFFN
ncbi:MAG: ArnT family glycosyltransferase, partial [Nitrospinota bacterium]